MYIASSDLPPASPDLTPASSDPYERSHIWATRGSLNFTPYQFSGLASDGSSVISGTGLILGISCYFYLFFYVLLYCNIPTWTFRAIFVLTSHLITMPLHVQITLSHWGTSTADLGPVECFAQHQLRTTMDVSCPQWLDFIHGGLQFQAVHHLFPRVPRHNLRKLQRLVQEFYANTEIEYLIYGFVAGNSVVLSQLQQVAEQAKILAACQKHMSVTGESGL
jgi:delta8-fatty-acid desaturase